MIAGALSLGGIPIFGAQGSVFVHLVCQGLPRSARVGADQNQRGRVKAGQQFARIRRIENERNQVAARKMPAPRPGCATIIGEPEI